MNAAVTKEGLLPGDLLELVAVDIGKGVAGTIEELWDAVDALLEVEFGVTAADVVVERSRAVYGLSFPVCSALASARDRFPEGPVHDKLEALRGHAATMLMWGSYGNHVGLSGDAHAANIFRISEVQKTMYGVLDELTLMLRQEEEEENGD